MPGLDVALTVVEPSDEPGREIGDVARWLACNCCTTSARNSNKIVEQQTIRISNTVFDFY